MRWSDFSRLFRKCYSFMLLEPYFIFMAILGLFVRSKFWSEFKHTLHIPCSLPLCCSKNSIKAAIFLNVEYSGRYVITSKSASIPASSITINFTVSLARIGNRVFSSNYWNFNEKLQKIVSLVDCYWHRIAQNAKCS